ncbi:ankyrin repeat domain-containing protein [Solimicrobium silvestre]|uniref:Ankyrin repeats (3 copies) n=1 Tax=Solimicrobium silvestre TaxID=2099400 RepID=A0A2S9GSA6_9BURK|nr:ankyrin repeat domain-containing protein [Solimicrobium silvestre]PRC90612.1 Ankyrin repeats (3 copies) [Solimicrobium silvestre]
MKNHANDKLENILRKYAALDMFEGYPINSPTSPGPDGDTPFHIAAYDGDIDGVKIMLPYVNDVNLKGDVGNTPLHYAISNRQLLMVEALISSGANVNLGNDYGDTPIDYMEGDEMFLPILAKLTR